MSTAPSRAAGSRSAASTHVAAGVLGEAVDRVDVDAGDGLGDFGRHLLDVDAALGGEHAEVQLGPAVEGEAGVVLLGDVGRVLDPDAAHDVALDVHAEDVAGVGAHLVGVGGQLDAARLAPAAHLHLGLDHDRVARLLGLGDRLVDRGRHAARPTPGCRSAAKYCLPWYSKRSN